VKERNLLAALETINEAADMCTNTDPRVLTMKGDILQYLERYEEAIQAYDLAHVIMPGNVLVFASLARCTMLLGRYEEALNYLDQIIAGHPEFAPALITRSAIFHRRGETAEAISDLKAAKAANPIELETNNDLAQAFLSLGLIGEAQQVYKALDERYPNHPGVQIAMGIAFYMGTDYISACDCFTRALELGAKEADVYVKRASCYLHFDNIDKALADLEEARTIDSTFHLTDFMLAQCRQIQKQWREAVRLYDMFLVVEERRLEEIVKTDSSQLAIHNEQRFDIFQNRAHCLIEAFLADNPAVAKKMKGVQAPQLQREPSYSEVNTLFQDTYQIIQTLNVKDLTDIYTSIVLARKAVPSGKKDFTTTLIRLRQLTEAYVNAKPQPPRHSR
jgi:tetratricopeptide (TPR) repeat protein